MPPTSVSCEGVGLAGEARLRRHWILTFLSLAGILLLPESLGGVAFVLYSAFTLAMVVVAVRRYETRVRRIGFVIALTGAIFLVGGIVREAEAAIRRVTYPFPAFADLFSLAAFGLFIFAILTVVRGRNPRLAMDPILDAIVGVVAVGVIQWTVIVLPYIGDLSHTHAEKVVTVGFAFVSLTTVGAAVLALVAGSKPSTSNRLLAAGLVMAFTSDVLAVEVTGAEKPHTALAIALTIVNVAVVALGAAGVLHPSVAELFERPTDPASSRRLSRRRIAVLSLALTTPPVVLLYKVVIGADSVELLLPALGSFVLAPLVLLRLGRLVHQNERLATQEGTLREAGEHLVESESDEDVAGVIESAVEQLMGSALIDARLVMAPFGPSSSGWSAELVPVLRAVEARVDSIDSPTTGDLIDILPVGIPGTWYAGLLILRDDRWGVLLVGVEGAIAEDQRNAITALCRQGAIAIRAVRRTEEQVRERAERRFGTLIENSSDIVTILDENNVFVYISPVSKRLLGIQPEEGAELKIPHLVHPDDRDKARRLLTSVRRSGHTGDEIRLRHLNGTYLWFEVQLTNLLDDPDVRGILMNARAVDDRKAAEELLSLSEARFKSLVQNNTDLVMVVDAHERVRYASPSSEAVVGVPSEALFDQTLSGVFTACDIDWNARLREAATDGRTFEFGFRHTSGRWRTMETVVTDLRDEPAVGGFVLNARDITERLEMTKDLEYAATHDRLTGLPNRARVVTELDEMLSRNAGGSTVAAICIDLDDFRDINDSLGQSTGDDVLKEVSARIKSTLSYGDNAARIGADEFAVIVERGHGEDVVLEVAETILAVLAEPFHFADRDLNLSASAGLAVDHSRDIDAESLLRNSITALHEAKREGRGRVVRFEHSMRTASSDRLELRGDLARAIGTDQLVVNYQPIVDMDTNEILGAEALVRWDHPERGRLSPALFVPLAEDSGLIGRLDAQVRAQALKDLSGWRSQIPGKQDLTVSVNLSVGELHSDDLVATVLGDLRSAGLPASALVLEVTESNLLDDSDTVRSQMESLRTQGVRLAVDDFGTGYSSLGYIDQFEFDILKIDRSFVAGLSNRTNQRIVTAVLDLASQLNAKVVAEGIETDSQRSTLLEMGCLIGQGYWFSRPVAAEQFRRLLTEAVKVGA